MNDNQEQQGNGPTQAEFDAEYKQLNAKIAEMLTEYNYICNVVLLGLVNECLNGIVASKNVTIHEAQIELIKFITSLQYINTATVN